MTSTVQCDYWPNPYSGFQFLTSPGVSEEANKLREQDVKTQNLESQRACETSFSRTNNASGTLHDLFQNCRMTDWDGRGAAPIPYAAIEEAKQVIAQLPEDYPMPEIIPEITGEVGLEWYVDPYRVLLLSLAGDGYIYFAGLYGFKNADHGSKPLAVQLNKKILSLLDDVYKKTSKE